MKDSDCEVELKEAFKVFDKNLDGFISAAELRQVIVNLCQKLTSEVVDEMVLEVVNNTGGKISYQDFVKLAIRQFAILFKKFRFHNWNRLFFD